MLLNFAVRQFGRLKNGAAVRTKGRNPNWTSDAAGICIDYVLDGPRREEDRFAQTRSSVWTKYVD